LAKGEKAKMNDKTAYFGERTCPKCHRSLLKNWTQLSSDEKFIAERQPANAEFSKEQRQHRLFCTNCWFETDDIDTKS
jgi:hypothetical protein